MCVCASEGSRHTPLSWVVEVAVVAELCPVLMLLAGRDTAAVVGRGREEEEAACEVVCCAASPSRQEPSRLRRLEMVGSTSPAVNEQNPHSVDIQCTYTCVCNVSHYYTTCRASCTSIYLFFKGMQSIIYRQKKKIYTQ